MKYSPKLLIATLALFLSAGAFAQTTTTNSRPAHRPHGGPPPGVPNADGTVTLPDGTIIDPTKHHPAPFVKNADGSITLRDGTVVNPNADGTYTLRDGHVIDLTKGPPRGGPGGPPGDHGPGPSGEENGF